MLPDRIPAAFAQNSSALVKPESTDAIIERLRSDLSAAPWVFELAKRSEDLRVIPALRGLFQEAKLSNAIGVAGIHTSQAIAISLIKLGVKDQMYFDELASYARRAIADDPPDPYSVYHVEGNERPEQTTEFNRWCANHGYRLDNCVGMWTSSYVMQLGWLGAAHDRRSIAIFREGLNGSGSAIVEQCVGGLAELNDKESIPLIARACARFSKDAVVGIIISAMDTNNRAY